MLCSAAINIDILFIICDGLLKNNTTCTCGINDIKPL